MKKIILIFACSLLVISFGQSQESIIVDSITIEYVDMDIETPFTICCDDFRAFFQEDIKIEVIQDSITIIKITSALKELPVDTLNIYPDTRAKMKLHKNGNTEEICVGCFNLLINSELYLISNTLRKTLNFCLSMEGRKDRNK